MTGATNGQIVGATAPFTGGGTTVAFSGLTSGTNTTAAMVVGTGASLAVTGSGTIAATSAPASTLTGTTLASNVVTSSLTSVGTLSGLSVTNPSGTVAATFKNAATFDTDVLIDTTTASKQSAFILLDAGTAAWSFGKNTDNTFFFFDIINSKTSLTLSNGNIVSPTLVTPALGTPASGVLTNCTGTAASLTAGHVTTNANLTGVITSVGNATSIASQTGTGTKFVVDTTPTLTSATLAAGTATAGTAPLYMTSGTNLTVAAAGAVEFDGLSFYATCAASSRQVIRADQILINASYTLTSQTAAQQMFNRTAAGALTVQGSTSYYFECEFALSSMSSSSGSYGFAIGGTATLTTISWSSRCSKTQNTISTPSAVETTYNNAAANTSIVTASTSISGVGKISGIIRINAAGTIIPEVSLGVASAAVVASGSWFRIWPIGSNAVNTVGNWS